MPSGLSVETTPLVNVDGRPTAAADAADAEGVEEPPLADEALKLPVPPPPRERVDSSEKDATDAARPLPGAANGARWGLAGPAAATGVGAETPLEPAAAAAAGDEVDDDVDDDGEGEEELDRACPDTGACSWVEDAGGGMGGGRGLPDGGRADGGGGLPVRRPPPATPVPAGAAGVPSLPAAPLAASPSAGDAARELPATAPEKPPASGPSLLLQLLLADAASPALLRRGGGGATGMTRVDGMMPIA